MMTRFMWIKRKPLATITICAIIMVASIMYWPRSQVVEAAIINPHPGLVGWWRFDEATGNTAKDNSTYGNDGTIYGATWVDGKYGKALSFGASDYVDVGDKAIFDFSNDFTIAVWVKMQSFRANGGIVCKGGYHAGLNFWTIGSDSIEIFFGNGIAWVGSLIKDGFVTGNWYHVVIAVDSSNVAKMYLGGVEVASTVLSGIVDRTEGHSLRIGLSYAEYFDGIIDEVRIYNRALSATEIGNLFQKGPDFSSRLLAKVPKGTTQFMATLSWQGYGSINVTIESPFEIYTEDSVPIYQKTTYDSGSGDMLNIKRLAVSVIALSSNENWYVVIEFDDVEDYRITVEVQR